MPLPAKAYDVAISAFVEGEEQNIEKIIVTQQFDEKRYIEEATQITANDWDNVNQLSEDEIITVKGNIVEIIEETNDKNSIMLELDSDNTQQIMVEYYGDTAVEVGAKRQFYGYIIMKKNQPVLVSHVGLRK